MKIALTQRVLWHKGRPYDALDHGWYDIIDPADLVLVPNHGRPILNADALILTGGNAVTPGAESYFEPRSRIENALIRQALARGVPILGICRGCQMLTMAFGGALEPVEGHMDTAHDVVLAGGSRLPVNSYHGMRVSRDPENCRVLARDDDGNCEAFLHTHFPVLGIMWHPERDQNQRILNKIQSLRSSNWRENFSTFMSFFL